MIRRFFQPPRSEPPPTVENPNQDILERQLATREKLGSVVRQRLLERDQQQRARIAVLASHEANILRQVDVRAWEEDYEHD